MIDQIKKALKKHKGNKAAAARELGIARTTLHDALEREGRTSKISSSPGEPPAIRDLRKAEKKTADLLEELKLEKEKRKQAEQDLEEILTREEIQKEVFSSPIDLKITPPKRNKKTKSSSTAIICACDWHAEANVSPDLVNNLNEFNLKICQKRVARLWEKSVYLIEFARQICDIQDAVLWLGGDLINGYIHEELQEGNFLGPSEAIVFIQQLVSSGIKILIEQGKLQNLRVICNYGNHSRSTSRPRISTGWKTNWEWLGYETMAGRGWGKSVEWMVPKGYHIYEDIQGRPVRFHHGDSIKYSGGIGGIPIPVFKATKQWNEARHADLDIFGHFHQFLDTWKWVSWGCLVGYDPYALSIKADYQPPTQTFIVIDKDRGKTMALPIFVEE